MLLRRVLNRIVNRIQTQDCMIKRELLIGFMTQRELDWACYRRGFNPHGKHRFEQESFLREWLRKSSLKFPPLWHFDRESVLTPRVVSLHLYYHVI